MAGNNKLTPFTSMNVIARNPGQAVSTIPQTEACLIYDISGGGMHLRLVENHIWVRPSTVAMVMSQRGAGEPGLRLRPAAGLHSARGSISSPAQEIFFLL
ncbi:hypothetical protein [Bradyrhizobium sp. NAS96.2]|uniref:hypothetical protein n=1 Tax=Bradyrhizobium sp. NAS96.2 TaxID=1680160 RepID=UPI0011614808|nr:hypothetical protein [Bradyrhizobium sp. NAS96.2]